MAAQLALADDFWMAAHDQMSGDSFLQPRPLGIGLGAAVLCELVLTNWIDVNGDTVYLHPDAGSVPLPQHDPAARGVLEQLLQHAHSAENDPRRRSRRAPDGYDERQRRLRHRPRARQLQARVRRPGR